MLKSPCKVQAAGCQVLQRLAGGRQVMVPEPGSPSQGRGTVFHTQLMALMTSSLGWGSSGLNVIKSSYKVAVGMGGGGE